MHTTLNQIKSHSPCKDGLKKLLKHLGKTKCDDEKLSLLTIYRSNGFDYTTRCMETVENDEGKLRKISCLFALSVKKKWDMSAIVEKYLLTQDENIREEVYSLTKNTMDDNDEAVSAANCAAFNYDEYAHASSTIYHAAYHAVNASYKRKIAKILVDFLKQAAVES